MFELLGWALLAGIVNALAGGGLFFTLPALLALGIPSTTAVATANVASWPGYVSAFWSIRHQLKKGPLAGLTLIGLLGGTLGALALVQFDASSFNYWVPWLLLAVSLLYARQLLSKAGFEDHLFYVERLALAVWRQLLWRLLRWRPRVLFMSITGQLRMGTNLQQHAIKLYLSMLASGATIVVYSLSGLVYWQGGLMLAVGYLIGGQLGAKLLKWIRPKLLAWSIVTFGIGLSGYYFLRFYG